MLTCILSNSIVGFLAHIIFYPLINRVFMRRTARLLSYVVGMCLDIIMSWGTLKSYATTHGDRRKTPGIAFDKYIFVRTISAMALGAGVVLGYMLDED